MPVDEALQVPTRPLLPVVTPPRPRKRFTAQQVEVLIAAFAVDEFPDRQRQQALALWLAVPAKQVQVNCYQFYIELSEREAIVSSIISIIESIS